MNVFTLLLFGSFVGFASCVAAAINFARKADMSPAKKCATRFAVFFFALLFISIIALVILAFASPEYLLISQ